MDFPHKRVGLELKKIRESLEHTQENYIDQHLSASTISRIENGKCGNWKSVDYYALRLGVNLKDIIKELSRGKSLNEQKYRILLIENKIEKHLFNEALHDIDNLYIDFSTPEVMLIYFLQGKTYYYMGRLAEAEKEIIKAIDLGRKHPEYQLLNVLSCALNTLSFIYYRRQQLCKALEYVEEAIEAFKLDGERNYVYHTILLNKMCYLEKMGRLNEAEQIIEELFEDRHQIKRVKTKGKLYEIYTKIKLRKNRIDEAISIVSEGLEELIQINAQVSIQSDEETELWILMGDLTQKKGQHECALSCYSMPLSYSDRLRDQFLLTTIYTKLAECHLEINNMKAAKEWINKAITIARKLNYSGDRFIKAVYTFGKIYIDDQPLKVIPLLEEALVLAEQQNLLEYQYKTLSLLTTYYKTKNTEKFQYYMELLHDQLQKGAVI